MGHKQYSLAKNLFWKPKSKKKSMTIEQRIAEIKKIAKKPMEKW